MRISALAGATLLAMAVGACGSTTPQGPTPIAGGGGGGGGASVTQIFVNGGGGENAFSPDSVSVAPGTTVVWVSYSEDRHRIVADDGSFDTGDLTQEGVSQPVVVNNGAGVAYHCAVHPGEKGHITVTS
jgi:plastocyanin